MGPLLGDMSRAALVKEGERLSAGTEGVVAVVTGVDNLSGNW